MREYIRSFMNGYSKSLEIFPNYNTNNTENDWVSIGVDIEVSMIKYTKTNEMDRECQLKKIARKTKKLK